MRRVLILSLCFVCLLFGSLALADSDAETDTSTGAPVIPALKHRSYDLDWTRWRNADADGEPKLRIEGIAKFPFMWATHPTPLYLKDFEDAALLDAILAEHESAYAESAVAGECDTDRLREIRSGDMLCAPGVAAMPNGNVYLVLYQPQTMAVAAVTTTIDNRRGVAAKLAAKRQAEREAAMAEPPPTSCGEYNSGEWIKAADFVNSLGLPTKDAGGDTTHYQCIVPNDGRSPYFQAYYIGSEISGGASVSQSQGSGGGSSGGDNGNGGGSDPAPCTDPLLCDNNGINLN